MNERLAEPDRQALLPLLDKVPTLLAVVPAAAILCSIFYWLGVGVVFKWSILNLLSVQDLLASAISWLPVSFLLWGGQWLYITNRENIREKERVERLIRDESPVDDADVLRLQTLYLLERSKELNRVRQIVIWVGLTVSGITALSILILPDAIPILSALLILIVLAIWFIESPISPPVLTHITPIIFLFIIVFSSFVSGAGFGTATKFNTDLSTIIVTENGAESKALVIASLTKGLLYLNTNKEIVFIPSDQIISIRKPLPSANKSAVCLIFNALC